MSNPLTMSQRQILDRAAEILESLEAEADLEARAKMNRYRYRKDSGLKPPVGLYKDTRDARNRYWDIIRAARLLRAEADRGTE